MSKIAKEARDKAIASGELPHEFLLRVSRGEVIYRSVIDDKTGKVTKVQEHYDFESRRDAAKCAAPYYAPKISTVEVIHGVNDAELDALIAKLATETGFVAGTGGEGEEGETPAGVGRSRRRVSLNEDDE